MIKTVDAINGLMKFEPDPYDGCAVEYINQFLYKLRSHLGKSVIIQWLLIEYHLQTLLI